MEKRLNPKDAVSISHLFNPALWTPPKTGDGSLTVAQVREKFSDLSLTEAEEAYALMEAYKRKAAVMDQEAKKQAQAQRVAEARKMWTADACYDFALERGKIIGQQQGFEFVLDEFNADVFELLSWYFACDERFEKRSYFDKPYSLQKGICLLSPVRGNGKTTLLDAFMYNKRCCFTKRSTKQMAKDFSREGKAGGIEAIEQYLWLLQIARGASTFYQDYIGIHYDDFGDEKEVLHMGNRQMISSMIINSIYDDHRSTPLFWCFHVSMNYKWSEYEQKYGSNTASRMEEMFNLIPLPGETRRK